MLNVLFYSCVRLLLVKNIQIQYYTYNELGIREKVIDRTA